MRFDSHAEIQCEIRAQGPMTGLQTRSDNGAAAPYHRAMKKRSEVDELFALPLSGFTEARNALAARMKKEKRTDEAQQVKALTKPTATAWAVNQLYWHHRADFDRLVAISDKVRKAQSGRAGDLRALMDERRKLLASLSSTAGKLLSEAGSAVSLDARRRVSTTLESLASRDRSDIEQLAGRLTTDLDPLGFESLGGLLAASGNAKVLNFRPSAKAKPVVAKEHATRKGASTKDHAKAKADAERAARERAEALKAAEKALTSARRDAARAEAAAAKAAAHREALEQQKQELEERLEAATKAERAANDDVKQTARTVAEAERAVTNAHNKR